MSFGTKTETINFVKFVNNRPNIVIMGSYEPEFTYYQSKDARNRVRHETAEEAKKAGLNPRNTCHVVFLVETVDCMVAVKGPDGKMTHSKSSGDKALLDVRRGGRLNDAFYESTASEGDRVEITKTGSGFETYYGIRVLGSNPSEEKAPF